LPEISLGSIKPTRRYGPRRTLIYGPGGIGKTTFAASAPNPILLPTEDGAADLDMQGFPLLASWPDFKTALYSLFGEHPYKTVVVDSIEWLETLIVTQVIAEKGQKVVDDAIKFSKLGDLTAPYWGLVTTALDKLRERGIGCVLIGHATTESVKNPDGSDYMRSVPRVAKSSRHLLNEWCDEVFFATYDVVTKVEEKGFNQESVKALAGAERVMYTGDRPSSMCKNRLSMPYKIPLKWEAYDYYIPKEKTN